jgi:hypothetical protein
MLENSLPMMPQPEDEAESFAYTDDELVSLIQREIRRSGNEYSTRLSAQRERSYEYYYGVPFGNERKGFSRHVSMDVFESVEDVKTKLLNTFTSSTQLLKFEEEMDDDEAGAQDATDYVHDIFYKQNRGYNVLHDVLHDGLVAKLGTVKYCWYERIAVSPERFSDVPAEALQVVLAEEDIVDFEVTDERDEVQMIPTEQGPVEQPVRLVSGRITRRETVGSVRVDVIAPENVFIANHAVDPYSADCVIIKYPDKLVGELVAEGYDPEIVSGLSRRSEGLEITRQKRHAVDDSWDFESRSGEGERSTVDLYEAYMDIDMDGDGIPEVWKFTLGGSTILDKERIAKKPLHYWTPYRIPHKAIGLSVADVSMDIQRTRSGVVRGVMDNIYLTNTSMKIADLSIIRNPRDLIDNPIGAVVNSPDPDAVRFVPQPQLNPNTFQALALLTDEKQNRVGLTKLPAQQVISHQNSEDMINALQEQGEERIAQMARGFAETFLKPLFIDLYNTGVDYGQVVSTKTSAGHRVLDPGSMRPSRHNMNVDVALTPDERTRRAQALMQTYGTLREDQQLAPLFGVEEKYAILVDFFSSIGTSSPLYLKNPNSEEGQQALMTAAQQAQEMEEMQKQLAMTNMQLEIAGKQAQVAKLEAEAMAAREKVRLQAEKQTAEGVIAGQQQRLAEDRFEWNQEIAEQELQLEKEQGRNVVIRSGGAS